MLAEHNGSTGAVLVNYIYAGSRMIAKIAGSTTTYFLNDQLSARLTMNTSGAVIGQQAHLPFGEDFAESDTQQKQHFTSYERDPQSGTDYAVNRTYSFGVGRFQSADPSQSSGGASTPQSWNRYGYVTNAPTDFVDPAGLYKAAPPPPDLCGGGPPATDVDTGGQDGSPQKDPFRGLKVNVSWKIPKSSRSRRGELATCGKFDLTIEIKNVPEGNPDGIYVFEVIAGHYPGGMPERVNDLRHKPELKKVYGRG